MRTITLCYDPLDCTCWSLLDGEYCSYCSAVCKAALANYEGGVGDWATFDLTKGSAEASVHDVAKHQVALAEFFEEGRAPTPPSQLLVPFRRLSLLSNFLEDCGGDRLWVNVTEPWVVEGESSASGSKVVRAKGKKGRGQGKPYDRSSLRSRGVQDVLLFAKNLQ